MVAVAGVPGNAAGAAALAAADTRSDQALDIKLSSMAEIFTSAPARQTLDEMRALLPDLEDRGSARRAFVEKARSLLDPDHADREDASAAFFKDDGAELMERLKVDEADLDQEIGIAVGAASIMPGTPRPLAAGGAAGVADFLSGFKASALNVLNYTTYYVMKAEAGTVGAKGVAPLIDRLASEVAHIHLVGHSFGARLVAAAAAASTTDRLKSMTLLQSAFSHNAFSQARKGFFRDVVGRQRVAGPIVITHTRNDEAVGVAYPLASRINGDRAAALGDENDEFGALGRNGAQRMEAGEVVSGRLLPLGSSYAFAAGKCFNLEASEFISGHSDVRGREVAQALRAAVR
jgi:hypothetical protein